MSTMLVTGGAGYVGSLVAARLHRAGHRVLVYDDLSRGHREAVPAGCALVQGDIADEERLGHLFKTMRVDAVLHFAALIEAGESMRMPERFFRNNSAGTLTLLESMLSHGVKKFIFSSTAALYGEPERVPIREDDRLEPTNAYGTSKLLVEQMLAWFHRVHGLRYASLRYFNAAGATSLGGEDHSPESHLVPLILGVALGRRDQVDIFGSDYPTADGTCVRDYVHIADLAAAHTLALEALAERDRLVYNLGSGCGYTVRQVVETARRVTGHPIPAVDRPRRPGDPAVLVASTEKIRTELGWEPRMSDLATIIGSAWEWHRSHPHGYRAEKPAAEGP